MADFSSTIQSTADIRQDPNHKFLVYGAAGVGKTFLIRTLDGKALVGSCEAGLGSLTDVDVDFAQLDTVQALRDMYAYLASGSHDYRWAVLDSISEMAEMCLSEEMGKTKDGRQAYGKMQEVIIKLLRAFRSLPMNVYFAAKMRQDTLDGQMKFMPAMPGATLTEKRPIAHDFDYVFCLVTGEPVDGKPAPRQLITSALPDYVAKARDPKHALDLYEPADLGEIRRKIIASYGE